jgi:hypothetical protein
MENSSTMAPDATATVYPPPPADVVYNKDPYDPERDALKDLPGVRYALDLFLGSHMIRSEKFCVEMDPKK